MEVMEEYNNNKINIIIPVDHIKVKEIKLELNELIKSEKELIKELFDEIKNIKNDIGNKTTNLEMKFLY